MEPDIDIWIRRAEESWFDVLHAHAEKLFLTRGLPSHDHSHHARVWNLCKSLLREISSFNSRMDQSLVDGVLIAALFHDLGMAHSIREDHGRLSREICVQWFREADCDLPERYEEILRAIEMHDRKDEEIYGSFDPFNTPEILAILSVADDLEALGTIGIYRYAEIYLMRGIPMDKLGSRILNNAGKRFERLSAACRSCPKLLDKYSEEYDELCSFYGEFNLQVKNTSMAEHVSSGPLGVMNHIRRQDPYEFNLEAAPEELKDYFLKLKYELEKGRI